MNFLEVIIIFWVTVFFLVASHIILKSYKSVLAMCFSEFGRRVAENASEGTDHGTAGPMLFCCRLRDHHSA